MEKLEEGIAKLECTRQCWFDLKLWQKGEQLVINEADLMDVVTRHFKRVDGGEDPRRFDPKSGRPLWKEERKEEEEVTEVTATGSNEKPEDKTRKLNKPDAPFAKLTKAQIQGELDKKDVPYDASATKEQLRQLLEDAARLEGTKNKDI